MLIANGETPEDNPELTFTAYPNGSNGADISYALDLMKQGVTEVVVVGDYDENGREFAQKAASHLYAVGIDVTVVNLADVELDPESVLDEKGDIVDWLWLYTAQFNETPEVLLKKLLTHADDIDSWRDADDRTKEIDEMLENTAQHKYNWLVPKLFEVGDRMVITGDEGAGKSTLLRQMAVCISSGQHPFFQLETFDPVPTLLIDLENSEAQVSREIAPLRELMGDRLKPQHLFVEVKPEGIDILTDEGADWLEKKVARYLSNGGVLIIGPEYKLAGSENQNEDTVVLGMQQVLDILRTRYGLAIVIEAHTKHRDYGSTMHRPVGSRQKMRWVEFGFHLDESGIWTPWRQARDATRQFPTRFVRGDFAQGQMPWVGRTSDEDTRFTQLALTAREHWNVGDDVPGSKKVISWMKADTRERMERAGMEVTTATVEQQMENFTQSKVEKLINKKHGEKREDWDEMFDNITMAATEVQMEAESFTEEGE